LFALLAAFLLLTSVPGDTAEEKTTGAPKTAAPAPPKTIPIEEIARRATEVSNLVDIFRAKLLPNPEIEAIRKLISQFSGNIDLEVAETSNMLREQPTLESLQTQEELWQRRQRQLAGWLKVLTGRASELQGMLKHLADLQNIWTDTRAAAQAAKAPESIFQQIDTTLAAIGAAPAPIEEQRAIVLDVQSRVAQQAARCANMLTQIDHFQEQAVATIMVRDHPPIWSTELWANPRALLPARVHKVAMAYQAGILEYIRDPAGHMQRHLGLFILLALLCCLARRQIHRWAPDGDNQSANIMVLDRPFAAALLVTTFFATSPFSQIPIAMRDVLQILALLPIFLLIHSVVEAPLVYGLYALGFLFTVDTVRQAFSGAPIIDQAILVFENLAGMMVAAWLLRKLRRFPGKVTESPRGPLLHLATCVFLFTFVGGLAAGSMGYVRLARLATSGILAAGTTALALYVFIRVLSGLLAFALRIWPLRTLQMVLHHRILLERRIYRLLLALAIIGWARRYLDYVGLLEPAISLGQAILAAQWQRGSINLSVGDIFAFLLTLLAAYLLSSFIRFVLEEDVYPRTQIPSGVSYAASSVLNYAILAIGFVVALGVLGLDLTKVTVLAGAFGVGIGFGLQSVVNNFVSGLILLFERPIHVGDTVEVGNLLGRVLRIGIRSSVIRTMQGAEIIVPNAQLITEQVTNWTLSDQLRRIDLPVGVSYGTAPKKVIELLEKMARAHSRVLENPAPRALFLAYGDSSINFELRAWTEFANWQQVHSDLTVAVYDAVYAAGLTFPFPQRDVHLLSDSPAPPAIPVGDTEKKA
jgi:potassium-dependent mechanosensitive channel